jgi:hypothetical protein
MLRNALRFVTTSFCNNYKNIWARIAANPDENTTWFVS